MSSVRRKLRKRAEEMIAKGGLSDHDYKIVEAKTAEGVGAFGV